MAALVKSLMPAGAAWRGLGFTNSRDVARQLGLRVADFGGVYSQRARYLRLH